ncbi:MAG: GNAT family N-acetyltransferase [Bacteroidetes bacterium]|nr:GNAT family N-acetyltransferase [Bacteroidota bacterium]MBP7398597.1 GNAT family N-acetyltransferase [Chitinophagales bacterium]MBK7109882.1 GNAT family N-acetyltransferase [Bacteroidota bacterium]MBK8487383.1 GNAT family N-acetyltransferase [Bacteroidota bacterium]MBK8682875.1 GNAT family N-acetyltransferase [Bacteroidota bacterium]
MHLPILQNDLIKLIPLQETDFEILYDVASDPAIWEQHPNKNRYERDVFKTFFEGAIKSQGAYIVYDIANGKAIGSTRFYDYDVNKKTLLIGYSFLAKNCWGKGYNSAMKSLMLNHAFTFVDTVYFHVGASNIRSQKAMEKLGAIKTNEEEIAYFGEPVRLNFVYEMTKPRWKKLIRNL